VVAEGVENESEAQYLLNQGCRVAQGFLFGPAMAPLEFRRLQQSMGPAPLTGDGVLRAPSAPSRVA
jgi:EAL domain-containing protein (putative c-di-GMP-specific phosphodiesterase class I)